MDPLVLLDRYGFPIALVCVLVWAIWRFIQWGGHSLTWFAENVCQPIVKAHLEFLGQIQTAITSQSEVMQQLAANQDTLIKQHDHQIDLQEVCVREIHRLQGLNDGAAPADETEGKTA